MQAAFDVLNDAEKRKMYDQYGSNYEALAGGGPGGPADGGAGKWTYSTGPQTYPFDLNDLFGGGAEGARAPAALPTCSNSLVAAPARRRPQRTARCRSEARADRAVRVRRAGGQAALSIQRHDGKLETIHLKIPVGIDDGKRIRLRGQGEPGSGGGPNGDILVTVRVSPHPSFRRTGKRLDVRVPVTLAEAVRGAKIDVPTPQGTIALSIPPGTSSGRLLRIKGHGVRPPNQTPGDLFAEIQIDLPEGLTDEERQQLADISSRHPQNPRAELRW